MNESVLHDRYPGARSFMDTDIDHRLFFGRDREINELFYQVLGGRLLVLFGKSGLGKTSLLQAGVFPRLREQDLLPLPVRLNRADRPLLELFTTAIAETCAQAGIDYTPGETGSLWEFFKTAVFWRGEALQTPVLVLDQFEEIFTLQSADNRQWLAQQLGELAGDGLPQSLRARLQPGEKLPYSEKPPTVKIVLSLREDYLGALQELSGEIPRILENRFRLTTMSREQARLAVVEPARLAQQGAFAAQPFAYEESAVEELLTFLSGRTGEIEPFQLQILCRQVEQQVAAAQAKGQQDVHVDKDYLGGRTRMEAILQNFYLDAVRRLPSRRRRNRARDLCEQGLLDSQGHRRILEEKDIQERYKVDTTTLQALVDARLLRKEERQEVFYYELSHDSLAQPVLNSRRWRMPRKLRIGLGMFSIIACTVLAVFQWEKQQAVKAQNEAEKLLSFLIYDLRDKLQPIGRLDLMEDVLRRVNAYYESMGTEGQKCKELMRSAAYNNQGDLLLAQGNLEGARKAFQNGLELAKRATQCDLTGSNAPQRTLTFSYERLGDMWMAQGDLTAAQTAYQESLKIREQLTQHDPNNSWWQRDLASNYERLGDVWMARGNLAAAQTAYQNSRKIRQDLVQRDPSNNVWRHDLAFNYDRLGNMSRAHGDLVAARIAYQESLNIREQLAQRDPSNSAWQDSLTFSYEKLGDVWMESGNLAAAETAYQNSLKNRLALIQRDPSNKGWQCDLASRYERLGDVFKARDDLTAAQTAYQESLNIRKQLTQHNPNNSRWQRDLASSYERLGDVWMARGNLAAAQTAYQNSLKICQDLVQRDPSNSNWQQALASSHERLGDVFKADCDLKAHCDLTAAQTAYQESLNIRKQLTQRDSNNSDWQRDLAFSYERLGYLLKAGGNLTEAEVAYQESLKIREVLVQRDPNNVSRQLDLMMSFYNLASAAKQSDKKSDQQQARNYYEQARAILRRLDTDNRLPPNRKELIEIIEKEMKALGN